MMLGGIRLFFSRLVAIFINLIKDIFLVITLACRLFSYFRCGFQWIKRFGAMLIYVTFLSTAFYRVAFFYWLSPKVKKGILYGSLPRNRLDLFVPSVSPYPQNGDKRGLPVVIFVTGGVWLIGYKGWGALLGKRLMERGVLVATLDYRNFPQGTVSDMVLDVSQGVAWVMENIHRWGGDPDNITLMGQSAGAHLSALAVVRQV
ncbi:hypothetical protein CYMTET_3427 [Cymbomonas tetramitiformis]|uniref:protein-S-isoprenylcysteine alpha-carbonyl methylesterase n=1 Tax=Cymbomonas tetramitiformis TaxID=36881 RepID=A0AAE0H347_9CHLO|nr:hypothetical protein CYMTET_3427 [Cymbomonas tetramitiformis]